MARRGGAAMASPADWQLILDWERRGVPLPVVLEGLERAFERRLAPAPRLALRSCSGAVEAAFAGYLRRRAGLPVPEAPRFGKTESVPAPVAAAASALPPPGAAAPRPEHEAADPGAAVAPAARRLPGSAPAAPERQRRCAALAAALGGWRPRPAALDPEAAAAAVAAAGARLTALAAGGSPRTDADSAASEAGVEETLEAIETELLRRLAEALREPLRSEVVTAAARPLAAYRRRMPPDTYREALAAAVRRRLPRLLGLPPLRLEPPLPGGRPPGTRLPQTPQRQPRSRPEPSPPEPPAPDPPEPKRTGSSAAARPSSPFSR